MMEALTQKTTGLRKAAVLMVVLGDKAASNIFRHLSQVDVQRLTKEIAQLDYVPKEIAIQTLEEYKKLTLAQEYLTQGGKAYAEKLLVQAFGERTAQRLLEQATAGQETGAVELDALQKSDPEQLAKFVQDEHPQTIALVLAHVGQKCATSILALLPQKTRVHALARLARMRQLSPDVVRKVSLALHKKIAALGTPGSCITSGGINSVADLLNHMDPLSGKMILEGIEQDDADLALAIRNVLFTFEDFLTVPETSLREVMAHVDKKIVAVALKGTSEELRNHIFKTMSSRAVEMLKEDIDALGPMRARDVGRAQQEIVEAARQLEAEGKISLKSEGEDEYIV
jgi:flagellar motor switch protein FliG